MFLFLAKGMAGKDPSSITTGEIMEARWIRYVMEEARFVKSMADLNRMCQKLPYLAPRLFGCSHKQTGVPLSLQIEPTNYCNISCICCSRNQMKRQKGYMDLDLFKKIIDDASGSNIRRVHLYLHGEPTLHPQLVEMIEYIKQKLIGVSLVTNGMLLNNQISESLVRAGVNNADHIIFSILGYTKQVHEKTMRGVDHEMVVDNLFNLLQCRKKHQLNGPIIETVIYAMPENEEELPLFIKYWRQYVDHVRNGGKISEQFANYGANKTAQSKKRKNCKNIWERMTVMWNGEVTLCCADLDGNYRLGDLKHNTIGEVWNNVTFARIRELHKQKKFQLIPLCANCDW